MFIAAAFIILYWCFKLAPSDFIKSMSVFNGALLNNTTTWILSLGDFFAIMFLRSDLRDPALTSEDNNIKNNNAIIALFNFIRFINALEYFNLLMKHIAVFGRNGFDSLNGLLKKYGFVVDEINPEIVVSYGGDGTFLMSERAFPGIPKVLIRNSNICNKCHNHPTEHVLDKISKGDYKVVEHVKLKAGIKSKELICTNDFVIRNKLPTHALRFKMNINGESGDELIGDGVVISTVFGSSGYYYSIARRNFSRGIGVAFNNLHKEREHLNIGENDKIRVEIIRGDAVLVSDNDPTIIELKEGDIVEIEKCDDVARLIEF